MHVNADIITWKYHINNMHVNADIITCKYH